APLGPDALEIPDQQRTKVDPRRQRRPPVLRRIKLRAPPLDKLVEALGLQQLIQLLVEGMPRRRCQFCVRDPQPLLLLPLLAHAHRHRAILQTMSVDTSDVFAYESRLAPRAARPAPAGGRRCSSNRLMCPQGGFGFLHCWQVVRPTRVSCLYGTPMTTSCRATRAISRQASSKAAICSNTSAQKTQSNDES